MEILVKDQDAAMLTSGVLISITAICSMTLERFHGSPSTMQPSRKV